MKSLVLPSTKMAVMGASVLLSLCVVSSCDGELDQPPMILPKAEHEPNMTIAEFKAKYWQDGVNYVDTVTDDEVIHGWVTSSDQSGNVYKKLYIQDESGMGLTIAIDQSNLYESYRIGQEVVVPLQGCFVGKYNGQQELGFPDTTYFKKNGIWRTSFMSQETWESLVEINGFYDYANVNTLEITIGDLAQKTDAMTLMKFQGALVRINGVTFPDANGSATYAEGDSYTNRNVVDDEGRTLTVRNSTHARFAHEVLPTGRVDVVGLLDFYTNSSNSKGVWQLSLRSIDDVIADWE